MIADIRSFLLERRGILFNLVFLLYLVALQPLLLRRLGWVVERGRQDIGLGILILAAAVAETAGIFLKTPAVALRLRQAASRRQGHNPKFGFLFLVWIFHTVVGVMPVVFAMNALGAWHPGVDETVPGWVTGVMVAAVIKELVILLYWFVTFVDEQNKKPDWEKSQTIFRREVIGEICLFFFSAVAFTTIWEFIAINTPISMSDPLFALLQYALAGLLCLLFFLPIRILYIFEEFLMVNSFRQNLLFWGSIALNVAFSLTIIPRVF